MAVAGKSITGQVTLFWKASSLKDLRRAAHDRAIKDGLGEEEAREYLKESADTCALMLLDPGASPEGLEIEESTTGSAW